MIFSKLNCTYCEVTNNIVINTPSDGSYHDYDHNSTGNHDGNENNQNKKLLSDSRKFNAILIGIRAARLEDEKELKELIRKQKVDHEITVSDLKLDSKLIKIDRHMIVRGFHEIHFANDNSDNEISSCLLLETLIHIRNIASCAEKKSNVYG